RQTFVCEPSRDRSHAALDWTPAGCGRELWSGDSRGCRTQHRMCCPRVARPERIVKSLSAQGSYSCVHKRTLFLIELWCSQTSDCRTKGGLMMSTRVSLRT